MVFTTLIPAFLVLSHLTLAIPTTIKRQNSTIEQWFIPHLDMHMMSHHTGLRGDPSWPAALRFNTTIDFDVSARLNYSQTTNTPTYVGHNAQPHRPFLTLRHHNLPCLVP